MFVNVTRYVSLRSDKIDQIIRFVLNANKAVSNRRPIWEPKPKIDFQHNTYSLQQSTHTEDLFWVSGET